ncbi:hypothetical protein P5V15_013482 [Pogonomyrmex californicus]
MWNTISRLFAKGSKTAVVQEEAATTTTTSAAKDEQQRPERACNGVADDDAPVDGTSAVHVFYDAMDRAMDRGASADDRRRPAAASAAATGAAAAASVDQQSSGGDSEHFSDAYDSRQVGLPFFPPLRRAEVGIDPRNVKRINESVLNMYYTSIFIYNENMKKLFQIVFKNNMNNFVAI